MQDIQSILESLQAIEADLGPGTHAPLLSVSAHHEIPTCDGLLRWAKDYDVDVNTWGKKPNYDRFPYFLTLYDKKQEAWFSKANGRDKTTNINDAISDTATKTAAATATFEAHKENKINFGKFSDECHELFNLVTEQNADQSQVTLQSFQAAIQQYDSLLRMFPQEQQKYRASTEKSTKDLQTQKEAVLHEQNLADDACILDEMIIDIYKEIREEKTQKRVQSKENKYTPAQIKRAEDKTGSAVKKWEAAKTLKEEADKEMKQTMAKYKQIKSVYDADTKLTAEVMDKLKILLPQTRAAAEDAAKKDALAEAVAENVLENIMKQLESLQLQEQEQQLLHANAEAHRQQEDALVRTEKHAVVAKEVALDGKHLQDVEKENADSISQQTLLVEMHETKVDLTEDALNKAKAKAEIELKQEQLAAGSPPESWSTALVNMFTGFVDTRTKQERAEAAQAAVDLSVAKANEKKAHVQAYEAALACAQKCLESNNSACALAKQEIEVYVDMVHKTGTYEHKANQLRRLEQECTSHLHRLETRQILQQNEENKDEKDVQELQYVSDRIEKSKKIIASVQERVREYTDKYEISNLQEIKQEDVNQSAMQTYEQARLNFEEAQTALDEALLAVPGPAAGLPTARLTPHIIVKDYVSIRIKQKNEESNISSDETDSVENNFIVIASREAAEKVYDGDADQIVKTMEATKIALDHMQIVHALRDTMSERINALCYNTIDIENTQGEERKNNEALSAKLNDDVQENNKKLDEEIKTTNDALTVLMELHKDDAEREVFRGLLVKQINLTDTIEQRLAVMRESESAAAAEATSAEESAAEKTTAAAAAAAAAQQARPEQQVQNEQEKQKQENARLAKEKTDLENARRERLQFEYDLVNESTRNAIDAYLASYELLRVACEARARADVNITHKEFKVGQLKQVVAFMQTDVQYDPLSHEKGELQDKIARDTSKISKLKLETQPADEQKDALIHKNKTDKVEAERQAAVARSDRFREHFLVRSPEWSTADIIPLFVWKDVYKQYNASIYVPKRKKYDAKILKRRESLKELIDKYNAVHTNLVNTMNVTIALELQRERTAAKGTANLQISEQVLRNARQLESDNLKTYEEVRKETIFATKKALRTVFIGTVKERYLTNLLIWMRNTAATIRKHRETIAGLTARQPEPAARTDAVDSAGAGPRLSVPDDSRATAFEKNKESALAIRAAIKANKREIDPTLKQVVTAYQITVRLQDKDDITYHQAIMDFKTNYERLRVMCEKHNENVRLYLEKVQLVVENAPNETVRVSWQGELQMVSTVDFEATIHAEGINEAAIDKMSAQKPTSKIVQEIPYAEQAAIATHNFKALQEVLVYVEPLFQAMISKQLELETQSEISSQEKKEFEEALGKLRQMIKNVNTLADINKESAVLARGKTPDVISKAHWTDIEKYHVPDYLKMLTDHRIGVLKPAGPSAALVPRHDTSHDTQHDEPYDERPQNDTPYTKPHSLHAPCSFKQDMRAFAAQLLALVYPPVPAKTWLARPPVARYAHPDRARTAGGSLELHALCARVAHIALVVGITEKLEPLAAHRFLVELPEHARLLALAVSALPAPALYAARAAPSREHANAAAIRACLSRASLAPLRACAAATVAAATQQNSGDSTPPINQSSQQYV
jgi:hypothetical protein